MEKAIIDNECQWILFGAGNGFICKYLLEQCNNIVAIIDNDEKKWGTTLQGVKVCAPESIKQYSKESTVVVIATYEHWDEMCKQMEDMGWGDRCLIAMKDLEIIKSYDFFAYCQGINLKNYVPTLLNIELSGICNCKCIYCPFHGVQNIKEGQKSLMSWETLRKVVEQVKKIPTIKKLTTVGAGEIFVHPEWFEMLQFFIRETGIKRINIYTNGMLLNQKNIDKLLALEVEELELEISIDGRTAMDNDKYRVGSNYDKIKKNISVLEEIITGGPRYEYVKLIITNCYPIMEEEIHGEVVNSKKTKVPTYLKQDFPNVEIVSQYTRLYKNSKCAEKLAEFKAKKMRWENDFSNRCVNLFYRMAINNRGEFLRCSCGHAGIDTIGNVFEDDILELWKNDTEMNLAREYFMEGSNEAGFCEGCPSKGIGEYFLMVE